MANGDPVSHDKLRGDLAELKNDFSEKYATIKRADDIDEQLDVIRNNLLTEQDIREIFAEMIQKGETLGWTSKARWIAILTLLLLIGGFALQVYNKFH